MQTKESTKTGERTHEQGCMGNYDYRDCICAMKRGQWPKFKVRTLKGGDCVTTIMERDEAEALNLKLMQSARLDAWDKKYATAEHVKTSFDQLESGSVLGFEPLGSFTHFERYTFEDSIRDSAMDLFEIVQTLDSWQKGSDSIHFGALIGKEDGDTLGKLVSNVIAKVERKTV